MQRCYALRSSGDSSCYHDTPPRCTVEAVIKEEKKRILLAGFSDNAREVRKRTQINNLLHGKLLRPFKSCEALKIPLCLPSSEDGLKAAAHGIASNSLHLDPHRLPLDP